MDKGKNIFLQAICVNVWYFKANKITTKFLTFLKSVKKKQPHMYCESMKNIIKSKMSDLKSESEPESEADSNFSMNLSDFHSDSD